MQIKFLHCIYLELLLYQWDQPRLSEVDKKNILKTKPFKDKISKKQIFNKKDNIQKVTKKIEEKNKKISIPSKKKSNETKQNNYLINSYIVYPSHGVGQIINIENTIVMQQHISCYLIYFDRERLTIKIPTNKVEIYNRWGVLVYETDQYDNNSRVFKGISEGRVTIDRAMELPTGTYYYILNYTTSDGEYLSKKGYVYLSK